MAAITPQAVKIMSKEQLETELLNRVYEATALLEYMESAGRISGNGHHKRQEVAQFALVVMNDSWIQK